MPPRGVVVCDLRTEGLPVSYKVKLLLTGCRRVVLVSGLERSIPFRDKIPSCRQSQDRRKLENTGGARRLRGVGFGNTTESRRLLAGGACVAGWAAWICWRRWRWLESEVKWWRQRCKEVEASNRRLGERQARLEALCPELSVGTVEWSPSEAPEGYRTVASELVAREAKGSGKAWAERRSMYAGSAESRAVKERMNAAIIEAIAAIHGDGLPPFLAADPRRVLVVLDAPCRGTSKAVLRRWPRLGDVCHQIVVPQMDALHYREFIADGPYLGVRAQRLDHWLCSNRGRGFQCVALVADFETRLLGRLQERLVPAQDLMRFFRFRYAGRAPGDRCVLALTVSLRPPVHEPRTVVEFVEHEARLSGYRAEVRRVEKYHLAWFLFDVLTLDDRPPLPTDGVARTN